MLIFLWPVFPFIIPIAIGSILLGALGGGRLHRWITIFGGSASSVILIVFLYASDIITDLKLKTGEKSDSFTIDKRGAF